MNAKLVEQLARFHHRNDRELTQKARAFIRVQCDPAFGWSMAKEYARKRERFPITMHGRDHWVFVAYMTLLRSRNYADRHVEDAFHIANQPGMCAKLKAILICGLGTPAKDHIKLVAEKTGIHANTVEAFEILFFNVLDRADDQAYLSEIVYPETRAVEKAENYFKKTPIADLMLRAAYNHRDLDVVVKMTGMPEAECRKECRTISDMMNKLASQVTSNAIVTAELGLINQPGVAMQRAIQLMKPGRQPLDQSSDVNAENSHDLSAELSAALAQYSQLDRGYPQTTIRPGQASRKHQDGKSAPQGFPEPVAANSASASESAHRITRFPEPVSCTWRNKDFDKPVVIVGTMSHPDLPDYHLTAENVGIPASEVFFGD